jgi:iron complex outermembrane receptor protein
VKQLPLVGGCVMVRDLPLAIAAVISVLVAQPLQAEEVQATALSVNDLEPISNSASDLLAQQPTQAQVAQVTAVQLNPTPSGIEVFLETAGTFDEVLTSSAENSLITDIPNAQVRLPGGREFRQDNPTNAIASVMVSNLDAKTIRVTVTGKAGVPTAEVSQSPQALILSVAAPLPAPQPTPAPAVPPPTTPTPEVPTPGPDQETPPMAPTPEAQTEEAPLELTVTAEQEAEGYRVLDATTATKTDTPLRDIPQSIQVIPREVIEDRQVVRLNELADNVSGVQPQPGYGGLSSGGFTVRGFDLGFETFRNGFRDFGFTSPRDVANIDRVEILKGPASVLYGSGFGFSGLINTVTKKPLAEPFYNPSLTIGSYNFYRPTLDIGGPLTDNGSLLYRLNAAYENAGSFRDFNENESFFVAPALTWKIGPRTSLTAEFEVQNYSYVFDRGLLPSEVFFDLPISRFLGEPGVNDAEFDSFSGTYNFEHEFSDNWKFRQGFNATRVSGNEVSVATSNFEAPFLEADGRTLPREASRSNESQQNYALQNEIIGNFNTGSIRHNVLFGVELARYRFAYDFFDAPIDPIDIFNPVYGAEPGTFEPSSAEEYGADNLGVYVQDLIELLPNLKVLAGVRFDSVDSFYRDTLADTFNFEQSDTDFSPRVGIVYQPSKSTSLYASWSNSFSPEFFSRNRTGEPFEPTTGEQFEIGVKQNFFDNRLSTTLALYDLTRQNVLTTDPEDPDFSIQTGEQKSRGIELDVAGEILPGWNIIATYAYTNAFVSEDNNIPIGDRLRNVPRNSASVWTTYEIQNGGLQGLGFGAGLVFVGDREVQLPNTIKLPSYVRADASIFYQRNNYRLALNFKNISNTKYYNTQGFFITPAAPFTVLGTVSVEF